MGISVLTGQCWRKLANSIPNFSPVPGKHVLLIGSRDIEPAESELLDHMGVRRVTEYAGRLRQGSFILPRDFRGDAVALRAEIEVRGVRRPARWACAQARPDGSLALKLKAADDPAWRKGI